MTARSNGYDVRAGRFLMRTGPERIPCDHVYGLTNISPRASCLVFQDMTGRWVRKTSNGTRGSVRYSFYCLLDDALSAGAQWAWRKDREAREGLFGRDEQMFGAG